MAARARRRRPRSRRRRDDPNGADGQPDQLEQSRWLPLIAASGIPEPAHRHFPKVMEDWDFERVIRAYGNAAERVRDGGLDGLELECASHLVAHFWSPGTNKRTDAYGGSLDNRMRLIRDILSEIRRRIGRDFIVGVRMVNDEQWEAGLSADEGVEIARRLNADGMIDFINVVRARAATDEGLSRVIPTMGTPSARIWTSPAMCEVKSGCLRFMPRVSRTWRRHVMRLPAASLIWWP